MKRAITETEEKKQEWVEEFMADGAPTCVVRAPVELFLLRILIDGSSKMRSQSAGA